LEDAQPLGVRQGTTDRRIAVAVDLGGDGEVIQHSRTVFLLAQTRKRNPRAGREGRTPYSRRWTIRSPSLTSRWPRSRALERGSEGPSGGRRCSLPPGHA